MNFFFENYKDYCYLFSGYWFIFLFFIKGKGKGIFVLKNGIKCYKVDIDEDSDVYSDW